MDSLALVVGMGEADTQKCGTRLDCGDSMAKITTQVSGWI
jgi:hypothetical protein